MKEARSSDLFKFPVSESLRNTVLFYFTISSDNSRNIKLAIRRIVVFTTTSFVEAQACESKNKMSYEQFGDWRQQFRGSTFTHRGPEELEQRQPRNNMKRPRGYSPPAFEDTNNPQNAFPNAKRMRRFSGKASHGVASNHGGFFVQSRSDDEVSLAEEAQTTPTVLPHHSIFTQENHNNNYQQPARTQMQQHESQFGYNQAVASVNVPSGNRSTTAIGASYATDYQPVNNLLGNLHLMRQQRRQMGVQSSQHQAQAQNHSTIIPPQQHHHQRQYGNYHSVPKATANNNRPGTNQSRKKTVSLRVSSNLY